MDPVAVVVGRLGAVDGDLDVRCAGVGTHELDQSQIQPQPRELAGDAGDHWRNPRGTGGREVVHRQRSGPTGTQIGHQGLEIGESFEYPSCLGRHRATGHGRLDPSPGALNEFQPRLPLQRTEMLADRRGGVAEVRRRALDRTVRHDRAQYPEPMHVHTTTLQFH